MHNRPLLVVLPTVCVRYQLRPVDIIMCLGIKVLTWRLAYANCQPGVPKVLLSGHHCLDSVRIWPHATRFAFLSCHVQLIMHSDATICNQLCALLQPCAAIYAL